MIVARRPPDLGEQLDAALVCACGGDPASSSIIAVRDDSVGVAMVEYLLSVGARVPRAL